MVDLPDGLRWIEREPTGPEWLAALPHVVEVVADRWSLTIGDPFDGGSASWVAPAVRDGQPVVVKVPWPDLESEHEADALEAWAGDGAVHLLAHDAEHEALLLERCSPGTMLATAGHPDPISVFVDLLPRLWIDPPAVLRTLDEEASRWLATMAGVWEETGRPFERRLLDAACSLADDLLASTDPDDHVLLHQDLHAGNVLAAEREPWLAIDPKPLSGERAFGCAPIVRDFDLGHSPDAVHRRLDRLSDELVLDRERACGWTIVQTLAWSFTSNYAARHHETVRWLLDR